MLNNSFKIGILLFMAQVYLPLGFPSLGGGFDNIVYQGGVARVHLVSVDPRTNDQLFRRYLVKDLMKMRGTMGEYARAAMKLWFGSKWIAVVNQMCMGDADGLWSGAWAEWDGMSQDDRDYIDLHAPYLATWNEPGRVWWALYQTLYRWVEANEGNVYHMPAVSAGDIDLGLSWWSASIHDYDLQADVDMAQWWDGMSGVFSRSGTWEEWAGPGPRDGTMLISSTLGNYLEVVKPFNHARVWYGKNDDRGRLGYYYGGVLVGSINVNGPEQYQFKLDMPLLFENQLPLRFVHRGTAGKKVDVDGVELWTNYKGEYLELEGGGWAKVTAAGALDGYYHQLDDSVERSFYFNFVGRYAQIYYVGRQEQSTWLIDVDGERVFESSAYYYREEFGLKFTLGPFRKTLHRCRVTAPNGVLSVDAVRIRSYKKDL